MWLTELGKRIRLKREKQGLKQQDIANALRVSPQAVSKWERGENAPDIAILSSLAQVLDASTDWLLSGRERGEDTLEATVLFSSINGAYRRSMSMAPAEFARWLNGIFYTLTDATLANDGVPVKYLGDGYLCFFSGPRHADRAVKTATSACSLISDDLRIGLNTGPIYLGAVGHPDYARPDVMGEVVNGAYLTMQWAAEYAASGVAATSATIATLREPVDHGEAEPVEFAGSSTPLRVSELPVP